MRWPTQAALGLALASICFASLEARSGAAVGAAPSGPKGGRAARVLQGEVRDDALSPIGGVAVVAVDIRSLGGDPPNVLTAYTGSDGRYTIRSIPPGKYTVAFVLRGHRSLAWIQEISTGPEPTELNAVLESDATPIEPAVWIKTH